LRARQHLSVDIELAKTASDQVTVLRAMNKTLLAAVKKKKERKKSVNAPKVKHLNSREF
jgi:hypothetical protein